MLQKLNERIQGVVAWIIIVLVAITFTLFGIDYYLQSRHESVAQVEVNSQPITKQTFELSYRRTRQLRESGQMTAVSENQLKQQVLNEMIVNTVSVQAARANGFDVTSAQANAAILSIPQFQADGRFSTDRYAQALNGAFFTPESFQQEVRQGMLLNQQRFALIGTSFALPDEIRQFVKLYMQTRDYSYLQIPALRYIKQANVTDQEIDNYYKQHQNVFLTPEMVSIDYLRLSMQDIKNAINPTPEQIKRYYDENQYTKPLPEVQAEIRTQLIAELAQIQYTKALEQLSDLSYQTPDSLEPVAKALKLTIEHSQPFARHGSDQLLTKNKQIVQAAFSQDVLNYGNNSEPIQFDNDSVVVLRVNKHIPATSKTLVDVKLLIAEKLARKKAEAEAKQLGQELLKSHATQSAEEKLTGVDQLQWHDVKLAARDSDTPTASINELAFKIPQVGKKAGLSLVDGDYVVVHLKKINDGKLELLDKEQVASATQQIEANYGLMDYDLYVNGLMNRAKIVRH
jgi:peptidyl-prolyl cis-trans isomerase D